MLKIALFLIRSLQNYYFWSFFRNFTNIMPSKTKFPVHHHKFLALRREYPYLRYEGYSYKIENGTLHIEFSFDYSGKYVFKPYSSLPWRKFYLSERCKPEYLDTIIFNIGMIELISYWKAGCPPEVIIEPHSLDEEQLNWWKKLYFNGLGEFFYVNGIITDLEQFMHIRSDGNAAKPATLPSQADKTIVPVGGGKDSAVTLELLQQAEKKLIPLIMNPRPATINSISVAGYKSEESIIIQRQIHPLLLQLNKEGFLNGHTPFSAMLAFYTLLAAVLTGTKNIALSNESSASESTIAETGINHQYSKSLEFEKDFRDYSQKFISSNINYYSFLRPLNELQIASLFSKFTDYHKIFRSCNAGSKADVWCGNCPKCLFTYIILSPFMDESQLNRIFNKDLFADNSLITILDELTGTSPIKPFDCVGTIDEINAALCQTIRKRGNVMMPALLEHYMKTDAFRKNNEQPFADMMMPFQDSYLNDVDMKILQDALKK